MTTHAKRYGAQVAKDGERVDEVATLAEVLVILNEHYIANTDDVPRLASARSGVRWSHHDEWRTIPVVLEHGSGDVTELAAWRVAELRAEGEPGARIVISPGNKPWISVERADGTVEPPSTFWALARM